MTIPGPRPLVQGQDPEVAKLEMESYACGLEGHVWLS